MTRTSTSITGPIANGAVIKAMFIGAGTSLLVILFFLTGAETQAHWPELWKVRPLLFTPLAGAFGGGLAYVASTNLKKWGVNGVLAIFLSVIVFLVALWMGIVLGLGETLWD